MMSQMFHRISVTQTILSAEGEEIRQGSVRIDILNQLSTVSLLVRATTIPRV